jgi:iron complex transport system ATP-binding protein
MITAGKITFRIGGKTLVDDVSLEVAEGEVVAILGPNGAGKSTLMKIMAGQIRGAEGAVRIGGRLLGDIPPSELARHRAVLPQSSHVPFEFSAAEVVMMGRSPHLQGIPERESDREIVRAAMELTDTGHLAERYVSTLSGGELQRVHLARVLVQIWEKPEQGGRCLFLDEPTSSLDLAHQHATLRIARSWAEKGTAVCVVLHDLNLAAAYADRILFMKAGRAAACGTVGEALTSARIEEVFGVRAEVRRHPVLDRPLVIPIP